jgi:CSLREA domain-containing protein
MRRGICACLAALGALGIPAGAGAATIKVTDTADDFFAAPGGTCSLREAVQAANTDASFGACPEGHGADEIVLKSGQGYSLSIPGADDANAVGDLDVNSKIVITPNHRERATIDANDVSRVLHIVAPGALDLSRLVITGGMSNTAEGSEGGAIRNYDGRLYVTRSRITDNHAAGSGPANGGAIVTGFGADSLTKITRSSITGNSAENVGGGIIWGGGVMTLSKSTVAGNHADSSGGGIYLGGYVNPDTDRFRMSASTVSGNDADGAGGGFEVGLYVPDEPQLAKATNVTISGNRTNGSGGGIHHQAGEFHLNAATISDNTADFDASGDGQGGGMSGFGIPLRNSIIAGNLNPNPTTPMPDCDSGSAFYTVEHNLVGKTGGCNGSGTNKAVSNPLLTPLGKHGGPTKTHALKADSKAIGLAGKDAPSRDQRGARRDADPDSGAYER